MINLFLKELRLNRNSFLFCLIGLSAVIILAMFFYPVISSNMDMIKPFLESPMMNNLINAMVPDIANLQSPLGFFATYSGVFSLMLGSIFAIGMSSKMLYMEEKEKTAEFLLAKPVKRTEIFFGKYLSVIVLLSAIFLGVCAASLIGIEMVGGQAPLSVLLSGSNRSALSERVSENETGVSRFFERNEDNFGQFVMSVLSAQMEGNEERIKSIGIDMERVSELLPMLEENPDNLFDYLRNNLDAVSGIVPGNFTEGELVEAIEEREAEFRRMKKVYLNGGKEFDELFLADPEYFLSQIKDSPELRAEFTEALSLGGKFEADVFIKYRPESLILYNFYFYLLTVLFASVGFFISAVSGKFSPFGISIGVVIVLYLLDTFTKALSGIRAIGMASPFRWVDNNVASLSYSPDYLNIFLFLVLSGIFTGAACLVYRKKDILV